MAWNQLLVGFEVVATGGYWEITTLPQALVVAGSGVVLALGAIHTLNGLARLFGWYTRLLLAGGYDATAVIGET